jgi:protein ImuB
MLWACLRFPQLALDAIRVDVGAPDKPRPFAVIDGPLQRRHVVLANAAARNAGVRSGQPLAAAQTLCPRLSTAPRDETAERLALESIAAFAYRFSAEVSIAAPDTIFLEIGASLSLFGGIVALERQLRLEIATFEFAFQLAAAPTAAGARVLAAHADGIVIPAMPILESALGMVPLAASGLDDKTIHALYGMGFRTLRDLFRLPRAELARRIGEESIDHLDCMRGLAAEALLRYRPPDRFERRLEFPFGIESHGALAFPLQRLIRDFARFLIARDGGVQRFALILGHERGATTRIEIGLLAPRRDASVLFELARARLENIQLPAPVHALTLRADDLPPLCPLHSDLFDSNRREQLDWPALAERLRARLGDESLHGLCCVADHRPGRAWRFVAPVEDPPRAPAGKGHREISTRAQRSASNNIAIATAIRPFWLLKRPIVLRTQPTRLLAGPERIESGWWDDHDKRRDYYVIETNLGERGWAFVPAGSTANWTLHGWFA